jgi:short-subunit dehydrogenase
MKTTLITGASSGIGESFARKLAARGDNVLLVARSEETLASLCSELGRAHGVSAQYIALDLSEREAPKQLFGEVRARGLEIELLVNNAGFGVMGDFVESDLERQLNMIDLNVRALTELCHRFLPPMRKRRRGAIINVASTASFQGVPYMGAYAATKAYVLALSEALWDENREYGIKVLALCPGVTDTNFFAAANAKSPGMRIVQDPDEVVETGLKALNASKSHVVSGWFNFLTTEAERLIPRSIITRVAGRALRSQYGNNKG